MSNLTTTGSGSLTTGGPTVLPTSFTFTNSSTPVSSKTQIRTTTSPDGEVETVTDITIVQPTDASSTDSAPPGPTESTGAGEKVTLGLGAWVVALLAVGVGMGFM
ncbi:hypothetical protein O988_04945 [Pseudogymnoascus sp. VKM F-3808]|nr:hypothetical protein O988_04945 [Pseudogymnoascus sp. VKM F-3808]